MSDFTEIENELKKLRPIEPSPELLRRIKAELAAADAEEKIVRPARFRLNWLALGTGLAAAALLLIFFQLARDRSVQPRAEVATSSPAQKAPRRLEYPSPQARSTMAPAEFIPTGATQVVYRTEDEGLLFPSGSEQPVRRVRSRMRESVQWQNPQTGASLRVSYPTEEVTLLPVYGH